MEERAIQLLAHLRDFLLLEIEHGKEEVHNDELDMFDRGVGQGKKDACRVVMTLFGDDPELLALVKARGVSEE